MVCHPLAEFQCESAWLQFAQETTVWVRGTCGHGGKVFSFHVSEVPKFVSERDNPLAGNADSSGKLHQGVEKIEDKTKGGKLKREPRKPFEKLQNDYQMLECQFVADRLEDVAITSKLVEDVNSQDLGWKAKNYPESMHMTKEAISQQRLGLIKPPESELENVPALKMNLAEINEPAEFNFPDAYPNCASNEIRNQQSCGACYAFAVAKMFSGTLYKSSGGRYNIQLSEQEVVSCYSDANGCGGGWVTTAMEEMTKDGGYSTRRCMPYRAKDSDDQGGIQCAAHCSDDLKYKGGETVKVDPDMDSVKKALFSVGPLFAAMKVCQSFHSYTSGVYEPTESDCSAAGGVDHAITLVGYGVDNGKTYWVLANSWGDKWGDKGYVKVTAEGDRQVVSIKDLYAVQQPTTVGAGCPDAAECKNGGAFKDDCSCWCPDGFSGDVCETCSRECQNGGTLDPDSCKCTCPDGYFGPNCASQFTLRWDKVDVTNGIKATFVVSYNLESYHASSKTDTNKVFRYGSNKFSALCGNCKSTDITAASGTSNLIDVDMTMGFGGIDLEHCYAAVLWLGANEFGKDKGNIKNKFPCLYMRDVPSAEVSKYAATGGKCLAGGNPITDTSHPLYNLQCSK